MTEDINSTGTCFDKTSNWLGTNIKDICKGKGHWSFAVSPLIPSKYHHVLYDAQVTLQDCPKPHISKDAHLWEKDYVRMPYSEKNLFNFTENNSEVIKERWKIIAEVLETSISTSQEFEDALRKYNANLPKLDALHYFFAEELDQEGADQFFTNLLPKIIDLALKLPELVPSGIPLLKQHYNRSLSLSQLQIACLLANAFLCTFPWKSNIAVTYPGVNFVSLFSAFARPERKQCICEKLKSICNYFRRVTDSPPVGVVTFERKCIPRSSMPRWDTLENNLGNTKVHITSTGNIEDNGLGFLQVDFANKNIGGGVLRYGCVQEEIRFVICPELIVSRLFIEQLGNSEAVIITGVERYNDYSGYGDSFEWAGNHEDKTPFDVYGRRKTTICVIDATHFNKPNDQFQSSMMIRELNKAFVGFSTREKINVAPVATGNWGCGAFRGSKQLKTLLQLIACNAANRDLVYYSFGDEELMDNFYKMHLFLANNQITIAQLWRFLRQFNLKNLPEDNLYSFIQQAYFDSKTQPTISRFFNRIKETKPSITPSTSFQNKFKINSESPEKETITDENMDVVVETPTVLSFSSSEDIIPSSQPGTPLPRKFIKSKTHKTSESIAKKLPKTDIGAIFDMLDGNGNQPNQFRSKTVAANYESPFSKIDQCATSNSKNILEQKIIKDEKMDTDDSSSQIIPPKKTIKDYFAKPIT